LIGKSVGFKGEKKGIKRRKTVAGEMVTDKTVQINLKITKHGKAVLFEDKKEGAEAKAPEEKKE
jgi:hypothetical protein